MLEERTKPKEKRRTLGTPADELDDAQALHRPPSPVPNNADNGPDSNKFIHVNKSALATFSVVFGHGRNGQVTFTAFRQAMEAAGVPSRQLLSSAFMFKPLDKSMPPMQFHVNHGTQDATIVPEVLLAWAGRLRRTYHWDLDTFREE